MAQIQSNNFNMAPTPNDEVKIFLKKKQDLEEDAKTFKTTVYAACLVMFIIAIIHVIVAFAVPTYGEYSFGQSNAFQYGGRNISPALMACFTLYLAGSSTSIAASIHIMWVTIICLIYYLGASFHSLLNAVFENHFAHFIASLMCFIIAAVLVAIGVIYALKLNAVSECERREELRIKQQERKDQQANLRMQQQVAMMQQQQMQQMMMQGMTRQSISTSTANQAPMMEMQPMCISPQQAQAMSPQQMQITPQQYQMIMQMQAGTASVAQNGTTNTCG